MVILSLRLGTDPMLVVPPSAELHFSAIPLNSGAIAAGAAESAAGGGAAFMPVYAEMAAE